MSSKTTMTASRLLPRIALPCGIIGVLHALSGSAFAQATEHGRLRLPHRQRAAGSGAQQTSAARGTQPPRTVTRMAPTPAGAIMPVVAQPTSEGELAEVVVSAELGGAVEQHLAQTRATYPGSVATVSPEELALQKTNNLGEVLARIPGVVYVDEDGRGTKPDIALRGLNPIRSEYVQLLADGVPTQPSMYSEQAAYYGVPAERLAAIEVYKGGAAVLFGPNTVGGVINVISRPPSARPLSLVLDTRLDSYGDATGSLFLSGTKDRLSYGLEYMHKAGNGFRDSLDYRIDDVALTLGYVVDDDHSARVHLQYYDERSETPGGLLLDQFRADRSLSNKPNDEFFGQRIEGDLRTRHQLTANQRIDTLLYAYFFQRNWFLQNFVDDAGPDLTLADDNGQFLRDFHVIGFEPKYTLDYDLGPAQGHRLTVGARIYADRVDRRAQTGNSGTSREDDGATTSDERLGSLALAAFAQNEFRLFEGATLVPGVRFEHIEQTRSDELAGTAEQSADYDVWAPGVGLKYTFAEQTLVYANATRSFRPPSFGDSFNPAIGASSLDLGPSSAWTYEAGVRTEPHAWWFADVGVFYTDFSDQVIVSAGTAASYDTRSYGFEGAARLGLLGFGRALAQGDGDTAGDTEIFLQGGLSVIEATFVDGAFEDNALPYVPDVTATFGALLAWRDTASLTIQGRTMGARFTDNANTVEPDPIGSIGELSAYSVFDLKARWQVLDVLALNAGVNNVFDESYATQRRNGAQKGIFPGPTRAFYAAATASF
jgi:Fe(3+) dicitrate transport protein